MINFVDLPVGTVKGKATDSITSYTIKGINSSLTDATSTVAEINKLLAIFGKAIAVDENLTLTVVKEVMEDE